MVVTGSAKRLTIRRELLVLAVIAVVAVLLRLTFLHEPFERDEGWYATIAQEILHGGIPYRDGIDQKPPGVFYLYTLAIALFGRTTEAVRIFTAGYATLTLGAVWWLARSLAGSRAGLWGAALFAVFSSGPLVQGSSSNSEVFLVLPLVLAACCFVAGYQRQQRPFLLASGLFAGVALLIKTVAVPYVALLFVCAYFYRQGDRRPVTGLGNIGLFLAPQLLLAGLTLGYFASHGALQDFLYWNVTVPLKYSKGGSGITGPKLSGVLDYLAHELGPPALLAFPTAIWLLARRRSLPELLVALLLPASCAGVLMPGMNFPHYFIQLFPFFAVLGGIGCARLQERRGPLLWVTAPLLAALFVQAVNKEKVYYLKLTPEQVSAAKYGPTFAQSVYVAEYLKARTAPSDYIFQWGFEPELYFLANRRTPSPFISSTIPDGTADPEQAIGQLLRSLIEKRPVYIVVQEEWAAWPGFSQVQWLLARDYHLETTIYYATIYRRNGS